MLSVKEQRFSCGQGARQNLCGPDFELDVNSKDVCACDINIYIHTSVTYPGGMSSPRAMAETLKYHFL